jgi:hypothetical protein
MALEEDFAKATEGQRTIRSAAPRLRCDGRYE